MSSGRAVIRQTLVEVKTALIGMIDEDRTLTKEMIATRPDRREFIRGMNAGATVAYESVVDAIDRWLTNE